MGDLHFNHRYGHTGIVIPTSRHHCRRPDQRRRWRRPVPALGRFGAGASGRRRASRGARAVGRHRQPRAGRSRRRGRGGAGRRRVGRARRSLQDPGFDAARPRPGGAGHGPARQRPAPAGGGAGLSRGWAGDARRDPVRARRAGRRQCLCRRSGASGAHRAPAGPDRSGHRAGPGGARGRGRGAIARCRAASPDAGAGRHHAGGAGRTGRAIVDARVLPVGRLSRHGPGAGGALRRGGRRSGAAAARAGCWW